MKPFLSLLDLLCFPLELLARLLWALVRFLERAASATFASPWGLLIPLTLLAVFFLARGLARNTPDLASHYASQWATCEDGEIPDLVDALLQMQDPGLAGLVLGLGSPREAVFHACHEILQQELNRWADLKHPETKFRRYRAFSEALYEHAENLSPTGRDAAAWYAHQILRCLAAEKNAMTEEARAAPSPDFLQANRRCEDLLITLDSVPRSGGYSPVKAVAPERETLARYDKRAFDPVLAYSGESYSVDLDGLNDPFATPRAERLYAYHRSPRFVENGKIPYRRPDALPFSNDLDDTLLTPGQTVPGELHAVHEKPLGNLGGSPMTPSPAESATKIAADHAPPAEPPNTDFARDYLDRQALSLSASGDGSDYRDVFISRELGEIPLDRFSGLPSSQLMRLLHHSDILRVNEARRTLISRDGFHDTHLKLAFRLYHPLPAVREELVSLLNETSGVRGSVWLTELLNDPDKNVRYRAASFLATSGDVALQQLLIEKGRRDRDQRIVDLSNKVLQQQRLDRGTAHRR